MLSGSREPKLQNSCKKEKVRTQKQIGRKKVTSDVSEWIVL